MSHAVWVGRVNRSATYEDLWNFLTANCGALQSLQWVAHKGFAIATFLSAQEASRARRNQGLYFHGVNLWMDELWAKDPSEHLPKNQVPTIREPSIHAPKQIVLKRTAARAALTPTIQPVIHQPVTRPPVSGRVQIARPPRVQPTTVHIPQPTYNRPPIPAPSQQADPKRRRADPVQSRLAPNFSISIQNTNTPSWGEEDPEPEVVGPYSSGSRFQAYAQLPTYQPLVQPYEVRAALPGVTTYYDDYASSKMLSG